MFLSLTLMVVFFSITTGLSVSIAHPFSARTEPSQAGYVHTGSSGIGIASIPFLFLFLLAFVFAFNPLAYMCQSSGSYKFKTLLNV